MEIAMSYKTACLGAMSLVLMGAMPALGAVIRDQHYSGPVYGGYPINGTDEESYIGQSFTAGMSARLVLVSMEIDPERAEDFEVSIWNAPDDRPAGNVLATTNVRWERLTPTSVIFPTPVSLVAGQKYAILVRAPALLPGIDPFVAVWQGLPTNTSHPTYPGGVALHGDDVEHMSLYSDFDFYFNTYVEVPEPACISLLAAASVGCRRRR
jgi:hypothetical protein